MCVRGLAVSRPLSLSLVSVQRKEVADVPHAKPIQNAWSQSESRPGEKKRAPAADKKDQRKKIEVSTKLPNTLNSSQVWRLLCESLCMVYNGIG